MKHRCADCAAFERKDKTEWGECRAGPPQLVPISDGMGFRSAWPEVHAHHWCLWHGTVDDDEVFED